MFIETSAKHLQLLGQPLPCTQQQDHLDKMLHNAEHDL